MRPALIIAALVASATVAISLAAAPASAAQRELRIPAFTHLRDKAVETVEVDVGGFLLRLAKRFTRDEAANDPHLRLLQDIDAVKVRSFKFDRDGAYSPSDVAAVRDQLKGPEWNAIARVHKRDPLEDIDVFVCFDDGKACGIAVIAAQARELTFVNVVGRIDIDSLAELEGEFGIPKVSENR